ncbi:uncharacterized protein LOC117562817 [Gymnodraco acuticeps]|uniref:Uncharacterized protein LOC117562817 n=1 Tax=Gymnodraco acuticeps TaxID=8218 RepID=A0A6P8VZ99_GYMAC|nr:uncharacterized protein LOC117562817 [Gymnodraco acuticeps]
MYQHLTNLDLIYQNSIQPICLIIRMCRDSCHKGKTYSRSIRSGSMFENSHVRLQTWMHFIYRFAQGLRLQQVDMLQEGITRSSATLTKLADKLRRVCKSAMRRVRRRGQQTIGRRSEVVMIDESKCGHKRKYNRGRASNRSSWVFRMLGIRNDRRRPILKIVRRRSARHLMPLIKKHIKTGSSVISDGWRSYSRLQDEGYNHLTVNHQESFVDPVTGAHTQNVERFWGICKTTIWRLRGNRTQSSLKDHLDVIEWTYWRGKHHRYGPLGMLLHDIRKKYKV